MFRYLLLLFVFLMFIEPGYSRILNVPAQYTTIQSAIDASADGDTVRVARGLYIENINLKGKKILLTSDYLYDKDVTTILNTIIDGGSPSDPNFASCVIMVSGEDSTTILQGFTLTHGKGSRWVDEHGAGTFREGGGILVTLSSPIIRYNYIVDNEAVNKTGVNSAGGGGIRVGDGNPKIYNNIIAHNKGLYGAGIVFNYTGGSISNNIIAQNEGGQDFGGGGIWIFNVSNQNYPVIVNNNTIVGNISYLTGGGIRIWSTKMSGKNNIIWGNSAISAPSANVDISGSTAILSYNCVQGGWTGTGNISSNPQFQEGYQLFVSDNSPTLDAGDPAAEYNDLEDQQNPGHPALPSKGTLRNDLGAYGGPLARVLPSTYFSTKLFFSLSSIGFKQIQVGDSTTAKIELQNSSQIPAGVDSLVITGNNNISLLYSPHTLSPWSSDSIVIKWKPVKAGVFVDTLKIYHNDTTQVNPFILKLTGRAKTPTDVSDNINHSFQYELLQNYPNPFNPSTTIDFSIAEPGEVALKIYDIIGQEVRTLISEYLQPGNYKFLFEARELSSGIYYYKLSTAKYSNTKTFILMK